MTRTHLSLPVSLLAVLTSLTLLLALPGAGTFALWQASLPLTGTVTTGDLAIKQDVITGGTWTRASEAFDPEADHLRPGDVLTFTVKDVEVTAVGENLRATFQDVTGAGIPEGIELSIDSTPSPVHGTDPDGSPLTVDLILTVTASPTMPSVTQTIDLTGLTVTFGNGAGWTDTATLDADTLRTGPAYPPVEGNGKVVLQFDVTLDPDENGQFGVFLQGPAEGTTIDWGWSAGEHHVTTATEGWNKNPPGAIGGYVTITGAFYGMGTCGQSADLVGALTSVSGWTAEVGSRDGSCAFQNARNLRHVGDLPATLTDASAMFRNAGTNSSVFWINLTDWDSSRVRTMAGMFQDSGLRQKDLGLDTSAVTDMSYMFAGATRFEGPANLTSAENVTTMRGMFQGASSYSGLVWADAISGLDVSQVTDMSHMFENAGNFNGPLQNWTVEDVEHMDHMFWGAAAFDRDLSGWTAGRVTSLTNFADHLPEDKWPQFPQLVSDAGMPDTGSGDDAPAVPQGETDASAATEAPDAAEPAVVEEPTVEPTTDPGTETPDPDPVTEQPPTDATSETRNESDDEH